MKEFAILLINVILLKTTAFDGTSEYPLNVGTVLFSDKDLKNNRWYLSKVELLRARRYFQSFIPPANLINTINEDYIDALMEYFEEGYATIKTEATDAETDRIMTVALSDVIGGYLKFWALPITKYAFYGGTVTQSRAVRLFKFYDELRNYMGTDGEGWTNPDSSILSSIDINVAEPKHVSYTRSMSDPCDYLAYFVKTPNGLSIPIPNVNWDKQSNTMFIPLKNHSLIPLESFNSSSALFKYYDAAKNCMQTSAQHNQENFDENFQTWLSEEVLPHLNDDRLYLAFGSILSLVNTSKHLYDTAKDMKELLRNSSNYRNKFSIGGMPIDLTSKKIVIITIILLLELGWCVPTLLYILCFKKKKEKNSNIYMFVEPDPDDSEKYYKERFEIENHENKKKSSKREIYESQSKVEINIVKQSNKSGGFKILKMPRHINVDTKISSVSKNSKGTGAQSFYSSKVCSTEIAKVIYDTPIIAIKPSLKDIAKESTNINITSEKSQYNHRPCLCTPNESIEQTSFTTIQQLESSKTVTLLAKNKNVTSKHRNNRETTKGHQKTSKPIEYAKVKEIPCPCTNCFKNNTKMYDKSYKSSKIVRKSRSIEKYTNENEKQTRKQNNEKIDINKDKDLKLNNGQPYFEITIGRPKQDICVDICTTSRGISPKTARPSKIPKRALTVATTVTQTTQNMSKRHPTDPKLRHKSLIPQPKKQIYMVDDIVIKNRDTSTKERKLNLTL